MTILSDVHNTILVKLHQLKQAAVAELKSFEGAPERILHLNKQVADLDTEIVGVAQRIKDTGAHTLDWATVSTIPAAAKTLLTANAPKVEPKVVAAQPAQLLAEAAPVK